VPARSAPYTRHLEIRISLSSTCPVTYWARKFVIRSERIVGIGRLTSGGLVTLEELKKSSLPGVFFNESPTYRSVADGSSIGLSPCCSNSLSFRSE
jgi:hypothetical protein